jgi:hypothetical protein
MPGRFRIHPAIGVARLGNSTDHFIGPESPSAPANWDAATGQFRSFRDASGRILRQGARFRVFEYPVASGGVAGDPREVVVGGEIVDIEWRVHLANRKASFFVFDGQNGADDLYEVRSKLSPNKIIKNDPDRTNLRNAGVPADQRSARLDIDPGEHLVSVLKPGPDELSNIKAEIPIKSLGTLSVDERGRLLVLGGYGESNSTESPPRQIDEYASNDTWFDDASDGSVKARITFRDGTFVDADPAWVLVGPPDFAPGIGNVVTLHDTLWDTAVRELPLPATPSTPALVLLAEQKAAWQASGGNSLSGFRPSFLRDIYPLLKRAMGARDVHISGTTNPNYHRQLQDLAFLATVSGSQAQQAADLRQYVFDYMRDPEDNTVQWKKMPRGLGDEYAALDADAPTPRSFLSLTRVQHSILREWAAGNFISDWPGTEPIATNLENQSPDDLDRAATENSVGGPFFPGIDVSWLIRTSSIFSEPFRLKLAREPEGTLPTSPLVVGKLELGPGFFSQQMALPWQADFYDCHRERQEDPDGNEYYFMWWTAHRPDDVFPSGKTTQERWVREFDKKASAGVDPDSLDNLERFNQMQTRWPELKFVVVKNGDHYEEEP